MILIDKGLIDLIAGYDRISQAETMLRRRWRQSLLQAYSRRRQVYEAELVTFRSRTNEFKKRFRIGIWLASLLLILGAVAFPAMLLLGELGSLRGPILCFSPILILAGLNGWALLGMLWLWQKEKRKPLPPPNPLENPIAEGLLPDWRQGLQGNLPGMKGYEADAGINHLIARLLPLEDKAYLLDRLDYSKADQIDLMMIGPKGIWLFNVIHLSGVIQWKDGVWTRSRGIHSLQNDEQVELARDEQAFESVWSSRADKITEILERNLPEIIALNPKIRRRRGGLVFTHPQARLVIPSGVPFNWGIPKFWLDKLRSLPDLPGFDERTSLQVVELLLCRYQELTGISPSRSMLLFADQLIRQTESTLKSWVAEV